MVQKFWANTFYKFYIFITQIVNPQKLLVHFIDVSLNKSLLLYICRNDTIIMINTSEHNIFYSERSGSYKCLYQVSSYIVPLYFKFVYIANLLILGMWISLNARKLKVAIINETTVTVVYFKIEISFLGFSRLKHANCHR